MGVVPISSREFQALEIKEDRADGTTVYNVYTYANENAKSINEDRKKNTNKNIDESKKPLNAPGKTEEEVYNGIRMTHWLEWKELSNDIKKFFKIL